ncbi:MAG TPA: response regulator [Chloroflexota bacterium]|jgi:DNA-binding response OmpR family regulator|nr:response regulator [Chloroflexota bacterium]
MLATRIPLLWSDTPAPPVLLVEDDDDMRDLMQAGLVGDGLPVTAVADGEQALTWAATHRPAAVVLDMRLPGMDGEEVAAQLRAALGAALPILVVTAAADPVECTERAGGLMYLRKPFDIDDLTTAVRAVLSAVTPAVPVFGQSGNSNERASDDARRRLERPGRTNIGGA